MQVAAFLRSLELENIENIEPHNGSSTILLVAPKTLLPHWQKELRHLGIRSIFTYHNDTTSNLHKFLSANSSFKVIITSYNMLVHNPDAFSNACQLIWAIFDEAHILKNPKTQAYAAARALPTSRRLLITGTPIQNRLDELRALVMLCVPTLLVGDDLEASDALDATLQQSHKIGKVFDELFGRDIAMGSTRNASSRQQASGRVAADELRAMLAPYFLRRTKDEVYPKGTSGGLSSIKKDDVVLWVKLEPAQRKLYNTFVHDPTSRGNIKSPLAALTALKKIVDNPELFAAQQSQQTCPPANSQQTCPPTTLPSHTTLPSTPTKARITKSLVDTWTKQGHRTVIFSHRTENLKMLQKLFMTPPKLLDGSITSTSERQKMVDDFQTSDFHNVLLVTSGVGGVGLTLTAACRCILYDLHHNPGIDDQCVDRIYRLGQTRDVLIVRLVASNTCEEIVYRRQMFKKSLSLAVMGGGGDLKRPFAKEELRELFYVGAGEVCETRRIAEKKIKAAHLDEKDVVHLEGLDEAWHDGTTRHDVLLGSCEAKSNNAAAAGPARTQLNEDPPLHQKIKGAAAPLGTLDEAARLELRARAKAAWQEVGEEAAYVSKNKDAGDAVVVAPSPAKPGRLQKANKKANGWRGVLGGSESEWSALRGAVAGEIERHRMQSVRHCDESSSSEMSGESSEASGDKRRASLGEEEEEATSAKSEPPMVRALREELAKQEMLLANKSLVAMLPDRGEKIRRKCLSLKEKLEKNAVEGV